VLWRQINAVAFGEYADISCMHVMSGV